MDLNIVDEHELDPVVKSELDMCITSYIDQHKGNAREINHLTMECITAITSAEAHYAEIEGQRGFARVLGDITGKNQKLQAQGAMDLATAQYAQQQILTTLAKQNLITFDLAVTVNNKLNMLVTETGKEINHIYKVLIRFFKSLQSEITKLSDDVETLKKNDKLSDWTFDIEYLMLGDKNYHELSTIEKIVCVVRDFYDLTEGSAHYSNIRRLKTIFSHLNVDFDLEAVNYFEFVTAVTGNPDLYHKILCHTSDDLGASSYFDTAYIGGLSKYLALDKQEKYLVETVSELTNNRNLGEIRSQIFEKFMRENACLDIYRPIKVMDFACELLLNLRQLYAPLVEAKETSLPAESIEKSPIEVMKEQYEALAKELYRTQISVFTIRSILIFEELELISLSNDCYADGTYHNEKFIYIELREQNMIKYSQIEYKTVWREKVMTANNQVLPDAFRKDASKSGVKFVVMLDSRSSTSVYLIPISKINIVKNLDRYFFKSINPWLK